MRLLVDTHCWLWYLLSPEKLNAEVRAMLRAGEHTIFFSAASAWEIVVKFSLGKLSIPLPPSRYIPERMKDLGHLPRAITQEDVLRVEALPGHHKDPFDRILIAQAQTDSLHLVTADQMLTAYEVALIWAGRGSFPGKSGAASKED